MPRSFDTSSPPFDRLSEKEAAELVASLDIGYWPEGETIIAKGAPSEHYHVVLKGAIEEHDDDEHVVAVLGPKEGFGARAVVHGGAGARWVAAEETLTYLIPRGLLMDLIHRNPSFAAFFYSDISRKLAEAARGDERQGLEGVLRARIAEVKIRPPIFAAASATIEEAGKRMADASSRCLLVHDGERVGIVTTTNLVEAVILEGRALSTSIGEITRWNLVTVDESEFVFDALITMTRNDKRRLVVTRDGEEVGILEDIDILGLFAGNSQLIPRRIDQARTIEDLAGAAADIQAQVERLHRQGLKVADIAAITSDLNRRLLRHLFETIAPESIRAKGCLMVMGSEGRGEQTVRTDQDNGLLLSEPVPAEDLERFRREFQGALAVFGFPPCPGNVMVSNPVWSQTVGDFVGQLKRWVHHPDDDAPMNLGIFFDAVAVAGDGDLLGRAKRELLSMMAGETAAIAHFARAIDQFPGPGGVIGSILATVGREEAIDIKKSGTFPIVHGIRSLAIEKGVTATSTVERIRAIAATHLFDEAFARDLSEAFGWFMQLRMRSQLRAQMAGTIEGESLVRPSDLTTLERDLLRDALRVVKQFREIVRNHFKLGMF